MRKIILLGGSSQQIVAITTSKRLGYYTILCDYLKNNPGQFYADKFYLISTTDKEAVLEVAKKENVDGIIAYASDPAAPTAAYVAETMGLPTNPYNAVQILCNKDRFRSFLSAHIFNTPRACGYENKEKALSDLDNFTLPIIIKPVDSSGSKGVTVLHHLSGVNQAIDFAFSFSRAHRIIIEEYIEKKHSYLIGGDIFVSRGNVIQWGLMNCHRDPDVNNLVPVGKSYPPLVDDEDLRAVKDTLQRLVSELGIQFGPMNVELIVDKNNRVFPIDIGPRSGGNMIPDLLGMIFGCDVVEMCVQAAMGKRIDAQEINGNLYYATLNLHSDRNGKFESVEYSPEIEQYIVKEIIYKKPGDEVHFFSNASDALGIIFLKYPDQKTMIKMEDNMNNYVKIVLQGER